MCMCVCVCVCVFVFFSFFFLSPTYMCVTMIFICLYDLVSNLKARVSPYIPIESNELISFPHFFSSLSLL
jgi:hypothetical protein